MTEGRTGACGGFICGPQVGGVPPGGQILRWAIKGAVVRTEESPVFSPSYI